jgi:menaquinone-9 beta-reductase
LLSPRPDPKRRAGGEPAGSAAAWQAAQTGARVVVLDKAKFPRDKPCGDGLTPRAVSFIQKMGLAREVARFQRVNGAKVFSPSEWQLSFPRRPGMPDHGHVARRSVSRPQTGRAELRYFHAMG